jgi:hypothetical protein
MTNKEKAINLIEKFAQIQRDFNQQNYYGQAKKCALICVDEMIQGFEKTDYHYAESYINYWKEVKQEIENL